MAKRRSSKRHSHRFNILASAVAMLGLYLSAQLFSFAGVIDAQLIRRSFTNDNTNRQRMETPVRSAASESSTSSANVEETNTRRQRPAESPTVNPAFCGEIKALIERLNAMAARCDQQ